MRPKPSKNHLRKNKATLIISLILLTLLCMGGFAYYYVRSKIYVPNKTDIFISEEDKNQIKVAEEKGITNILLVGIDARGGYKDARTDTIILTTVDAHNKRIKLTSFMRDMYVPIPEHGQNKINHSYFIGGPELLMKTLNYVFDVDVQYYVSIDFKAFQEVVDKLGGVDLEVKEYEVKEINKYIKEVNGNSATLLSGAGFQHLNGQQTLSYCRIRKVGNSDYERTERQRRVLGLIIDKARQTNIMKLTDLFTTVLPYVRTNVPTSKLMSLGLTAYKFGKTPVENMRVPVDGGFKEMNVYGMDVLVPDVEKNILALDNFIFSNGSSMASVNLPIYMVNNFHAKDTAIDKRGKKKPTVKIDIPKEALSYPKKKDDDDSDVNVNVDINKDKDMPGSNENNTENTATP